MRAERSMMAFAGRRGFGPGLFFTVAAAVLICALRGPRPASAAETVAAAVPGGSIVVAIDRAKIVKLPERTATLVIGNPLIADAVVQPGGIVVITAKSYGATNMVALDRKGETLLEQPIQVVGPSDQMVVVYRGIERESYSCAPVCERRITLGDTPTFFSQNLSALGTFTAQAQGQQK